MLFFFWFLFAVGVGVLASNRGRSGVGWFLLSMLISPLLGLLFVAVSKDLAKAAREAADRPGADTHVKCAQCAEWVLPEAKVCKHCGAALVPVTGFQARRQVKSAEEAKGQRADMQAALITLAVVVVVAIVISTMTGIV